MRCHWLLAPLLVLTGCGKLVVDPGLRGRFVAEDTGAPIAAAKVIYRSAGGNVTKETTTAADGSFEFAPTFTRGYAGWPCSPLALRVTWELVLHDKHNPTGISGFVRNTEPAHAMIEAGEIKIARSFITGLLTKPKREKPPAPSARP